MPPLYEEEMRINRLLKGTGPFAPWDKGRCINGWKREIHRLKAYPIGGLPCTDKAREAMGIHAEYMRRAYDALEAWTKFEGE